MLCEARRRDVDFREAELGLHPVHDAGSGEVGLQVAPNGLHDSRREGGCTLDSNSPTGVEFSRAESISQNQELRIEILTTCQWNEEIVNW